MESDVQMVYATNLDTKRKETMTPDQTKDIELAKELVRNGSKAMSYMDLDTRCAITRLIATVENLTTAKERPDKPGWWIVWLKKHPHIKSTDYWDIDKIAMPFPKDAGFQCIGPLPIGDQQ